MKIINASYEILDPLDGQEILRKIERCGRVCYKSEGKITETSAGPFVGNIIKRGHEAVLEHVSITVRFVVDRGVSHELVRHRLASYCQESTRYCKGDDGSPDEKSEILQTSMEAIYLPPIDINNPIQVEERIIAYLEFCKQNDQPPEKAGMASWLKITPQTLRRWETGEYRASTHKPIIEKYVSILESYTVKLLLKGKIMPASGIFILKNQHGYRDVVDIAQVPPPPLGELQDPKELERRIMGTVIDADFEEVKEEPKC